MFGIILTLLLVYLAANLLLAITMVFVAFIESIVNIADAKGGNKKRESGHIILEVSSYAFAISLVISVAVSAFLLGDIRSFEELGHISVGVMIVVQLTITLIMLVSRSNNKLLTTIVSIVMFLCCRYLLLHFDYWFPLPIPFLSIITGAFSSIPAIGQVVDSSVVLFLLLLIPATLRSNKNQRRA
jgi:hypothetical protein